VERSTIQLTLRPIWYHLDLQGGAKVPLFIDLKAEMEKLPIGKGDIYGINE